MSILRQSASLNSMSTESSSLAYRVTHRVFVLGLLLKGVNATLELAGGTLLLVLPFETLRSWATTAVGWVVGILPPGWTGHLTNSLAHLHQGTLSFVAWYFLSHGAVKAFVIGCLLRGKQWAYPLGIFVFLGFGIYQTWEIFHGGGAFFWVLNALDAGLIALTALEWVHAARSRTPAVNPAPPGTQA